MKYTNKYLPPVFGDAIARALTNDPYDPGDSFITTTTLVGPPLIRLLRREHADELTEDVQDSIWSLTGQAIHKILERSEDEDSLVEERLFAPFVGRGGEPRVVSGQIDYYSKDHEGNHVLADWKFTSVWSFILEKGPDGNGGLKPEWEAQANVNAELLRRSGFQVDTLAIVAILKDWSRTKARTEAGYPPTPIIVVPVPMWSSEDTTSYISKRLVEHEDVDASYQQGEVVELCSREERWSRPTVYRVKKKGTARAVRGGVKNTPEDAYEMAQRLSASGMGLHEVEVTTGLDVRCADYCPVRLFCKHGKKVASNA